MSNVNRILSFIIGLIVLIILLLFINSRLNARNQAQRGVSPTPTPVQERRGFDLFGVFRRQSPTPTPTSMVPTPGAQDGVVDQEPTVTPQPGAATQAPTPQPGEPQDGQTGQDRQVGQNGVDGVQEIPRTGAPTVLIPIAISAIAGGSFLRKFKKK